MSVHSELQNLLKNKSGNAPAVISSRSGDVEEGAEYFDMRTSGEPNALEIIEQKEEALKKQNESAARKQFYMLISSY